MGAQPKAVIGRIDQEEAESEGNKAFTDVLMLPIPMPTYKALSDAAARRGMSVAALISLGFKRALEE
jgi:predicted HicB family RNase H-like nuclease